MKGVYKGGKEGEKGTLTKGKMDEMKNLYRATRGK